MKLKSKIKAWLKKRMGGTAASGTIFVIAFLVLIVSIGFMLIGGQLPANRAVDTGSQVVIISPVSENAKADLQLYTFLGITVTPTPTPMPTAIPAPTSSPSLQQPALCQQGGANNEPEILVGYSPANGQTVGSGGQIKVWVNDEGSPIIAPGEIVNPTTGQITTPGDRTAKAGDGYLWEPALYIAPQTAENGGTPHFPSYIKGDYNPSASKGSGNNVPGMDPVPAGSQLSEQYTGEDIWDVNSLGLVPGTYVAEFVIHDGDDDRGVGCVTITIQ